MGDWRLRAASADDRSLLRDATLINVNQLIDRYTREDVERLPQFAHYFVGFPGEGDFGYVAESSRESLGVVWVMHFNEDDPSYGFVRPDVPELSICVFAAYRGMGVGSALMSAAIAQARRSDVPALSLSVERGNRARSLYVRTGFRVLSATHDAETMLLSVE